MARKTGGNFGDYKGIPLKGTYGTIREERLTGEFIPYHLRPQTDNYVEVAKLLAEAYINGNWGPDEIKARAGVNQLAAADHDNLKGDFIITAYILSQTVDRLKELEVELMAKNHTLELQAGMLKELEDKQPKKNLKPGTGKHLSLTDFQIESILRHRETGLYKGEKMTQQDFCRYLNITRTAYNRVVNLKYKNVAVIERVKRIQDKIKGES